ncbi:4'-phosphopantetheinyl transferase family protein [Chryseobacterium sp. PMSZPI]|uniref:4'-phosphopantetheinyl transferase family protein n=1 Tax=Chryseobacterium sp. PMSZPI TaxID=1033900 RepID=UPI000C343AD0|nr:4'-phosphopantetheinyl transferase superfamily protein [Chryseobacterium sp. PMSZPI]PKF75110.1 4-phosphopantetheinyl transferase [Chryseobacterium sp. PMSZPI]
MVILHTFISEKKHQKLLDTYLDTFSDDFKNSVLRYKRWQDAQLSLLGRVLLQYGLRTYYDISDVVVDRLSNHKPFLKGQKLHFNISHSKNLVVCAIAEFPIGIDVEFKDTAVNYLDFQFQMTNNEFQKIHDSEDKTDGFFKYWTYKEAVIKAHGSGMMIPLESFEVIDDKCFLDGQIFFTKEIFIDHDYYSCIASDDEMIKSVKGIFEQVSLG